MTDAARGQLLAQQLLAEALRQPYEEPIDTPVFGREGPEAAGDRALYDDIDDYDGWSATPPEYKDGTVLPNLSGWSRTVSVVWVDPTNHATVVVSDSGIKRIQVSVLHNDIAVATVTSLRTAAGDANVSAPGTAIGGSGP